MTRETKLGLGVATSFLSLVAVVAYSSWNKTEAPPPAPEAPPPVTVAQVQPSTKHELKPAGSVEQADFKDGRGAPLSHEQPLPFPLDNGSVPPANVVPNSPAAPVHKEGMHVDGGPPQLNPGSAGPAPLALPTPPKTAGDAPLPADLISPGSGATPKAPTSQFDPNGPLPPSGEMPAKGPAGSDPKLDGSAAAAIPNAPIPINNNPPPGFPTPPPVNGTTVPANSNPAVSNPNPPLVNPVAPPAGLNSLAGIPTPPPAGPTSPGGSPNPVPPPNPNPLPPEPKQIGQAAWPAAPVNPAEQKAPLGAGTMSEIGTQSTITSPPIAIPAVPSAPAAAQAKPQVESFNERRYVCQPTDTDFVAVSKQTYKSDKYAQALMLYNRDHPIGKAAVQQGLQLQPGAEVYVPPLYVLEAKYGNAIPNLTPLPQNGQKSPDASGPPKAMVPVVQGPPTGSQVTPITSGPAPTAPVVPPPASAMNNPQPPSGQPNQPAAPKGAPNVPPAGQAQNLNPASTGQYKLYTVPAGGQQFYEIARDTLGDGRRWSEIYQLNQQHDPQLIVPAGTQLKLPPEAYVRQ